MGPRLFSRGRPETIPPFALMQILQWGLGFLAEEALLLTSSPFVRRHLQWGLGFLAEEVGIDVERLGREYTFNGASAF